MTEYFLIVAIIIIVAMLSQKLFGAEIEYPACVNLAAPGIDSALYSDRLNPNNPKVFFETNKYVAQLEQAARRGSNEAALQLSDLYYYGSHVECNLEKSAQWSELAANRGDLLGASFTATTHFRRFIRKPSLQKAFENALVAGTYGDKYSQFFIGEMFERVLGVRPNLRTALEWYRLSAERGYALAKQEVAHHEKELALAKSRVSGILPPVALLEKKITAPTGDLEVMFWENLGLEYLYGNPLRCSDAKNFLEMAANRGSIKAQYWMGRYFYYGKCAKDSAKAFAWFLLASQNNLSAAQAMIAFMYLDGQGIKKNSEKARELLESAILSDKKDGFLTQLGIRDAAAELGYMKLRGVGGKTDPTEGMNLLTLAASKGHSDAQRILSTIAEDYSSHDQDAWEYVLLGIILSVIIYVFLSISHRNRRIKAIPTHIWGGFSGPISHLPREVQAQILGTLPKPLESELITNLSSQLVAELTRQRDAILAPVVSSHIPAEAQASILS